MISSISSCTFRSVLWHYGYHDFCFASFCTFEDSGNIQMFGFLRLDRKHGFLQLPVVWFVNVVVLICLGRGVGHSALWMEYPCESCAPFLWVSRANDLTPLWVAILSKFEWKIFSCFCMCVSFRMLLSMLPIPEHVVSMTSIIDVRVRADVVSLLRNRNRWVMSLESDLGWSQSFFFSANVAKFTVLSAGSSRNCTATSPVHFSRFFSADIRVENAEGSSWYARCGSFSDFVDGIAAFVGFRHRPFVGFRHRASSQRSTKDEGDDVTRYRSAKPMSQFLAGLSRYLFPKTTTIVAGEVNIWNKDEDHVQTSQFSTFRPTNGTVDDAEKLKQPDRIFKAIDVPGMPPNMGSTEQIQICGLREFSLIHTGVLWVSSTTMSSRMWMTTWLRRTTWPSTWRWATERQSAENATEIGQQLSY